MKKIIIIGGGGHSKVLIDAIVSTGSFEVEGLLDSKLTVGSSLSGVSVLGTDAFLDDIDPEQYLLALGVGSVAASEVRKNIFESYVERGFEFPVIIHSTAYLAKPVATGNGAQIMAGAIIQPSASIGENVIINTGAIVEHDSIIHAHSHISPGAVLGGAVEVGECSHVGLGAKVLQGVKLGRNVTVGAGAVVVGDIDDGAVVKGVPAR